MLCIRNPDTDPHFNLAAEEYVLKNFSENCFMLWRNRPSIIVGNHQNSLAEINLEYVRENNIDVENGIMKDVKIFGDFFNTYDTSDIEDLLKDTPHEEKQIKEKLNGTDFNKYFHGVEKEVFVKGMF